MPFKGFGFENFRRIFIVAGYEMIMSCEEDLVDRKGDFFAHLVFQIKELQELYSTLRNQNIYKYQIVIS